MARRAAGDEAGAVGEAGAGGELVRELDEGGGEVDAGDVAAAGLGEVARRAADAGADVEQAMPGASASRLGERHGLRAPSRGGTRPRRRGRRSVSASMSLAGLAQRRQHRAGQVGMGVVPRDLGLDVHASPPGGVAAT